MNTLGRKLPATDQGPKSHPRSAIVWRYYRQHTPCGRNLAPVGRSIAGGGFWNKNISDIIWPVLEKNALWYRLSVSLHADLVPIITWLRVWHKSVGISETKSSERAVNRSLPTWLTLLPGSKVGSAETEDNGAMAWYFPSSRRSHWFLPDVQSPRRRSCERNGRRAL